jgi:tRNA G18 (ribose-2'-O)-methylase SpoU
MTDRGYFAIGIFHGKTAANLGTLWRAAHAFNASMLFTVGRRYERQASDTTKAWRHVPLFNYTDIDDLVAHLPHACPLVAVELAPTACDVRAFVHPERACYLLGAEDHGLTPAAIARCHRIVQLPGERCLNVATAGSIVLYDRWLKRSAALVKGAA